MARYRKIDVRIWNDEKFRTLSDNGKLTFLFLLTHPHMTSLGAMRATIDGMASELGWQPKAFAKAFGEAFQKGLVEHDPNASFVGLKNFLKYNGPESPNVVKSWASQLDLIPECSLKAALCQRVKDFVEGLPEGFRKALPKAFESLPKDFPYPEHKPELKLDQEPKLDGAAAQPRSEAAEGFIFLMAKWNKIDGVTPCKLASPKRRRDFAARVQDAWWVANVDEALDRVAASSFCRGGGKQQWLADIDWFLRPDTVAKLIEGKYDDRTPLFDDPRGTQKAVADYLRMRGADDEQPNG